MRLGWIIFALFVWWVIVDPHGAAHAVDNVGAFINNVLSGHA